MNTIMERCRAAVLVGAAASVLLFAGGAKAQNQNSNDNAWLNEWWSGNSASDNTWPYAEPGRSPVLVAVGDISCQPGEEAPAAAGQTSGEANHEVCTDPKAKSGQPFVYTSTSLWQSQEATANEIESIKPDAVAILGDLQYQVGRYLDFEQSYDLTYGAFKKITYPAPGNHEFYDEHSETGVAGYGYFSYFNGFQISTSGTPVTTTLGDPCPSTSAGCGYPGTSTTEAQPIPRSDGQAGHFDQSGGVGETVPPGGPVGVGDGWYSYNLGAWHLISLNIECETQPGGCANSSGTWFAQETEWLKNDLATDHSACTLAYWHQPTYSAADGLTLEGNTAGLWWQMLYDAGADLVLNGHDHLYARYAPIKPHFDASADTVGAGLGEAAASVGTWLGTSDPERGIREFIVGTGGETVDTLITTPCTTSSTPAAGEATCATGITPATDWDGIFNKQFLENGTGDFWGVMALTLNPDGYAWDYESALEVPGGPLTAAGAPETFSDKGSAKCHGGPYGNFAWGGR